MILIDTRSRTRRKEAAGDADDIHAVPPDNVTGLFVTILVACYLNS